MMKFLLKIILIAGLTYLLQLVLPFWIIAVVAFLLNYAIKTNGWSSFFSGFIAIFLLWFIVSTAIESHSGGLLVTKVGNLFGLSNLLLKIVTAIIGALIAGLSGLTARMLFVRGESRRSGNYYS